MSKYEKGTILRSKKQKLNLVNKIFTRCKTDISDKFLEFLNNYHSSIKLACEKKTEKFLDTKIYWNNNTIMSKDHKRFTKSTSYWSSSALTTCIWITIKRGLCRAQLIPSDFNSKKMLIGKMNKIRRKFMNQKNEYVTPPHYNKKQKFWKNLYL